MPLDATPRTILLGLISLGIIGLGAAVQDGTRASLRRTAPPPLPIDSTALAVWKAHLELQARDRSWWWTSNATWAAADGVDAYAMRYEIVPGGTAGRGCLWGLRGDAATGVYWYFYQGWDGAAGEPFFHQASPDGATGMGRGWTLDGATHHYEQTFRWPDGRIERIAHHTATAGADTLITESRIWRDGGWTPQRRYVWVRRTDAATPCLDASHP